MTTYTQRAKNMTTYTQRAKNMTTYTQRAKNILKVVRGLLLTPDSNRILVGANEDEVLIFREESSGYTQRAKN